MGENYYGRLIWKGFYGPARNILLLSWKDLKIILGIPIVFFSMGAFFIYVPTPKHQEYLGWMLVIFGIIFPPLGICARAIRLSTLKNKEFITHTRSGKRDWDIYEHGLYASFLSETAPDHIEKRFIPFDRISKVYLKVTDANIESIVQKMKERDEKDLDFDPDDYIITKSFVQNVKECVFIATNDSYKLYELDRDKIRDFKRFSAIIRQNVKDVE